MMSFPTAGTALTMRSSDALAAIARLQHQHASQSGTVSAPDNRNQLLLELLHLQLLQQQSQQQSHLPSALNTANPSILHQRPPFNNLEQSTNQHQSNLAGLIAAQANTRAKVYPQLETSLVNNNPILHHPTAATNEVFSQQSALHSAIIPQSARKEHKPSKPEDEEWSQSHVKETSGKAAVPPKSTEKGATVASPVVASSKKSKKDTKWFASLEELKEYKLDFGDCIVPRGYSSNPRLANWVAEQRKQYTLYQSGKACSITSNRIEILNGLGFTWNAQEAAWNRHVADLKQFHTENGHCNVPLSHKKFPKLGLWVKEKRRHYSLLKQGKKSLMNTERAAELEEIGLQWDTQAATWHERFVELTRFQQRNGHCNVPCDCDEFPKLHLWVRNVRKEYKQIQEGNDAGCLTIKNIRKLEDLGFDWKWKAGDSGVSDSEANDCKIQASKDNLAQKALSDSFVSVSESRSKKRRKTGLV